MYAHIISYSSRINSEEIQRWSLWFPVAYFFSFISIRFTLKLQTWKGEFMEWYDDDGLCAYCICVFKYFVFYLFMYMCACIIKPMLRFCQPIDLFWILFWSIFVRLVFFSRGSFTTTSHSTNPSSTLQIFDLSLFFLVPFICSHLLSLISIVWSYERFSFESCPLIPSWDH